MPRHTEPFRVQGHALSCFPNLAAPPLFPAPFHIQIDCSDTAGAQGPARRIGMRRFRIEHARVPRHSRWMKQCSLATRFGDLTLTEEDGAIVAVGWGSVIQPDTGEVLDEAARQMAAYDAGKLEVFDLPLRVAGSDLQRQVCAAIAAIPFGHTRTYGEIARDLEVSAQSVGQACGGNPIPVIIPCHRVMGAKGLTGFSGRGGVETKVALLRHEGAAGLLI